MWEFIDERKMQIAFNAYQHVSLVVQAVIVAGFIAVALAVVVTRVKSLEPVANAISVVGLTIPSLALLGLLIPVVGIGVGQAFLAVAFYAALPILRNAVVGLKGVDQTLLESARGIGMGEATTLMRVRIPLAWPVILAGVRVSTQMSMGIAAIAAYGLGPGLGAYIFTGLAQVGGANALNSALVGTVGIVLLALVLDALLLLLGRMTTSKGIRLA
ncbi:MAG TPA: ABC transporter permease [Nocardioidaceae bacterium]|nr:ABC transporter permease [Nocardioidaceae bacterium]